MGLAGSVTRLTNAAGHFVGFQGSGILYALANLSALAIQTANSTSTASGADKQAYLDNATSGIADTFSAMASTYAGAQAHQWSKPNADVAAATAMSETPIARVSDATKLLAVFFTPSDALTGDASSNATIGAYQRSGTGAPVLVASLTTTASWTAFVPMTIPLVGSPPSLAEGDVLTLAITKNGAGVIVPAGLLQLITGASS